MKMRVLWCVNILFPEVAKILGLPILPYGGWMIALAEQIRKNKDIKLGIAALYPGHENKIIDLHDSIYYVIAGERKFKSGKKLEKLRGIWADIIKDFQPDIIHIHGTEYPHGLELIKVAANYPLIVSIQGLVSVCQKYFYAGMEIKDLLLFQSLRDMIKMNNLFLWRKDFIKRAKYESAILRRAKYIIGRTRWDYANVKYINPNIKYYHCDEILRNEFYENVWNIKNIRRHTIFSVQPQYPLKGVHILLKAISLLKPFYPDIRVLIPGKNLLSPKFTDKIKFTGYEIYLRNIIKSFKLKDNVEFVGLRDSKDIVDLLLNSHVFVIPSAVENSPNSLAEAMLVGVPCVGSYSGGIPDILDNKELLYPFLEAPMLAERLKSIFESDDYACKISEACHNLALKRHDKNKIVNNIISIYREVLRS